MRHLLQAFILLIVLALAMASCAAPFDAAEVRAAIEESNAAFVEAYNSGDAAGVAALYSDSAVVMPNDEPAVVGREAIQAFYAKAFETGLSGLTLEVVSVNGSGNFAYEIGKYTVMVPIDDQRVEWAGKYLVVWERQADGRWMMKVDMANNDGAAKKE